MKKNEAAVTLNNESYSVQDLVGMEVIFPMSRADFDSATSITTQVLASAKAKEASERGDSKGMFEVVLDSDGLTEIGLQKGTVIPVEMRGNSKPVVPWGFVKKYK